MEIVKNVQQRIPIEVQAINRKYININEEQKHTVLCERLPSIATLWDVYNRKLSSVTSVIL